MVLDVLKQREMQCFPVCFRAQTHICELRLWGPWIVSCTTLLSEVPLDVSHTIKFQCEDKAKILTLLTRMSVASKCLPNILGDSPGMGSILTQTSCPFFATSTCLWFISILVTIPMSTNYKNRKINVRSDSGSPQAS